MFGLPVEIQLTLFLLHGEWSSLILFFTYDTIHKVRTQVGGGRSHDKSVRVRTGGGELKPSECVRLSTVYFPFLKISSIKKKNENDWGNGGFTGGGRDLGFLLRKYFMDGPYSEFVVSQVSTEKFPRKSRRWSSYLLSYKLYGKQQFYENFLYHVCFSRNFSQLYKFWASVFNNKHTIIHIPDKFSLLSNSEVLKRSHS